MSGKYIKYRSGYKYQLAEDFKLKISIKPKKEVDTQFIALDLQGNLTVKSGYAWDGVSGPVIDTDYNLRASLVHDALYQLMRQRYLSVRNDRDKADKLFKKMCKEDGVLSVVAQTYYEVLKKLGKPNADPTNAKEIKKAP